MSDILATSTSVGVESSKEVDVIGNWSVPSETFTFAPYGGRVSIDSQSVLKLDGVIKCELDITLLTNLGASQDTVLNYTCSATTSYPGGVATVNGTTKYMISYSSHIDINHNGLSAGDKIHLLFSLVTI